jgi:hypothetical protein
MMCLTLSTAEATDHAAPKSDVDPVDVHEPGAKEHGNLDQLNGIDKSALVIATPAGIGTESTFAMSPSKRVWSVAASNVILIIFAICSRARLAAK